VHRALLVARQRVTETVAVQRVVDLQHRTTRVTEQKLHALLLEGAHDDVRSLETHDLSLEPLLGAMLREDLGDPILARELQLLEPLALELLFGCPVGERVELAERLFKGQVLFPELPELPVLANQRLDLPALVFLHGSSNFGASS
jgi:hypothetical protein